MIYKYISNVTSIKRDNYYLELISSRLPCERSTFKEKGSLHRYVRFVVEILSKSVTLLNDTFKFEHEFGYVAA